MNKRDILFIGPFPPPYGGVAIVVRDLLKSPLISEFNIQLVKTQPIGENEIKRFIKDLFNIIKKFRKFKAEIVHIQTSYDFGWPKHITYALISKMYRKKVIIHHHGIPANRKYLKGGKLQYIYPPKFVISIIDHVIAISDEIGNIISQLGKPEKVTVVRNGVDKSILDVGLNKKIQPMIDKIGILYMGAITRRKGIPEFLEMIKFFHDKKLDIEITYSIIGTGELDNYVDNFLEENDLKKIVDRRKIISEKEKIEILKNNDLFVLQSDHEGLPIAILESMASGLVIITTPVGGIPDAIKHKENGFLISPHNEEELINSIKWIIENPNFA
ncbi:MAG: glycosyltransferase family 4 protein, partial [Thermoplasmatales archaeon]|nr:glycosyltransferase family 4 protein [Thermoplasmatales archaeon]